MGLGASALITTAKKEKSGPPFSSNSADNGLSVDSVSGRIVLGNDQGDAMAPAKLLSNREVVMNNGFFPFTVFLNSVLNQIQTLLSGDAVQVVGGDATFPNINCAGGDNSAAIIQCQGSAGSTPTIVVQTTGPGGQASLGVIGNGVDFFDIYSVGAGLVNFRMGGIVDIMSISSSNFRIRLGATIVGDNGASVQVSGSFTRRLLVTGKGAGAYNVDRDLDSDKQFINSGAAIFNLPTMVGSDSRPGFVFRLCIKNLAGSTIQAAPGQTIFFGSLSTSSGGTLASTDVGAYCKLIWDGGAWLTETFLGAWFIT